MTQSIDESEPIQSIAKNVNIVRINSAFYHCALLAVLLHFGNK